MKDLTIEQKLQMPFPPEDIEWRAQSSGMRNGSAWAMIMPYVTNRANQERLDEVFGVFGWSNEFREIQQKDKISFLCGITVYFPPPEGIDFRDSVTKWDGADETNFENFKGGLSGSMKRASVQLGIGRYLYKLSTFFAELSSDRKGNDFSVSIKKNKNDKFGERFFFNAPQLPAFALPENFVYEIKKKEGNGKQDSHVPSFTQQCADIKSLDDLKVWYAEQLKLGLNDEDKASMTSCKDGRKNELIRDVLASKAVAESKDKATTDLKNIATNKYTFEELKAKKLPELHQVCKEFDLMGWSKKSKSDIVNLILKHINK